MGLKDYFSNMFHNDEEESYDEEEYDDNNENDVENDNEINEDHEEDYDIEEDDTQDLEKKEKEEKKNFKTNAKMVNCPTILQPPFSCPDCKKHSLYMEPVAGLIVRDGILAIGACIGVEVPPEYYSPFFCCVNKKCKEYYRNTGTKYYFDKNKRKLKKIKNYLHISR